MTNPQLEKGYVLLARAIEDSAIWRDDPHVLKLFIYLVMEARHNEKPKKYPGFEIKRGELVTSLSQILEDNEFFYRTLKKWSRAKVGRMIKQLEDQGYVKVLADTYGSHIRICNYETYQNAENYKRTAAKQQRDSSETVPDSSETVVRTNNNDNNGKNEKNDKDKKSSCLTSPKFDEEKYGFDSFPYKSAKYLRSKILENDPRAKVPKEDPLSMLKWSQDMDKLNRLGAPGQTAKGYKWQEIGEIINWCQDDNFWKGNILSASKLRKQVNKLVHRMKEQKTDKKPKEERTGMDRYEMYKREEENGKV